MAKEHHKYYSEDTEQRKKYFDKQLLSNAKSYAKSQGISLSTLLSQITDFESFKEILEVAWSQDSSLLAYFEGMDDEELKEFFNREIIQKIVNEKEVREENVPELVIQENKKTQNLFLGEVKDKKTGKTEKVFVKKIFVEVKGKKQQRYRDSKGRFCKRV